MWRSTVVLAVVAAGLAGCGGYVDRYEKAVYDWQPTYCYKSLASVECYRKPYYRDRLQLVNYYGPHPSRYDPPAPPTQYPQAAPPMIHHWVKDPEPKVTAAKRLTYADVFPPESLAPGATTPGTQAFLRQIQEHLAHLAMAPEIDPPAPAGVEAVPAVVSPPTVEVPSTSDGTQPAPAAAPTTPVDIAPPN